MEFRQLIPEPTTVEIDTLLSSLELSARAGEEVPYAVANFIASVDGRATFHGRSGALGDESDKALFHGLREQVDAIYVGTGTLRVERYGRLVSDPDRRRRRLQAGRSPEPLASVVTRTGMVPLDIPLFDEPDSRIVIFSPVDLDVSNLAAHIEVERLDPGMLTLTTVFRRLRSEYGIASLLCEGGPTVFASLVREQLVDELFLTLSPKLTGGGSAPTITSGPELSELCPLRLLWALERGGSLFLRYAAG